MIPLLVGCAPSVTELAAGPGHEGPTTRWVLVGDAGRATAERDLVVQAVAQTCQARGCDALWLLGDNVYDRGFEGPDDARAAALLAPWLGLSVRLSVPVWWVVGNHDHGWWVDHERVQHQLAWAAKEGAVAPGPAYHATLGPAEVVVLDTTEIFWLGDGGQAAAAAALLARSDRPWRVVLAHHPLVSHGRHGSAGAYEGWSNLPWVSGAAVAASLGALAQGPANLLVAAHDHNRQFGGDGRPWWIVSGAGATAQPLRADLPAGVVARDTVGFHWLELSAEGGRLLFLDRAGEVEEDLNLPRPLPLPPR